MSWASEPRGISSTPPTCQVYSGDRRVGNRQSYLTDKTVRFGQEGDTVMAGKSVTKARCLGSEQGVTPRLVYNRFSKCQEMQATINSSNCIIWNVLKKKSGAIWVLKNIFITKLWELKDIFPERNKKLMSSYSKLLKSKTRAFKCNYGCAWFNFTFPSHSWLLQRQRDHFFHLKSIFGFMSWVSLEM